VKKISERITYKRQSLHIRGHDLVSGKTSYHDFRGEIGKHDLTGNILNNPDES